MIVEERRVEAALKTISKKSGELTETAVLVALAEIGLYHTAYYVETADGELGLSFRLTDLQACAVAAAFVAAAESGGNVKLQEV